MGCGVSGRRAGGRYQQAGDVIYDTTPIRPGQQSRAEKVALAIPYPTPVPPGLALADFGLPGRELERVGGGTRWPSRLHRSAARRRGNQTVQGKIRTGCDGEPAGAQPVEVTLANLILPARQIRDEPAIATPFVAPAPEPPPATIFAHLCRPGHRRPGADCRRRILYWKYIAGRQTLLLTKRERLSPRSLRRRPP